MGLFGGSAQATNSNQANILFNPQVNVGDGSTKSSSDFDPISTTSPKLDDSLGVSASVAMAPGSSASSGLQRSQREDGSPITNTQPYYQQPQNKSDFDKYMPYVAVGAGAYMILKSIKKNKKAS